MKNPDVFRRLPVVAIGLVAVAVAALAQERRAREDVEGLMEAYVISKLQQALELSDEQFARVVLAQKKLMETRRNFRAERNRLLEKLREALQGGQEDEMASLLTQLDEQQKHLESQQWAGYQALDEILDVEQRARYRLLEQEIQRRFQEMVREVREKRDTVRPNSPSNLLP